MKHVQHLDSDFKKNLYSTFSTDSILDYQFSLRDKSATLYLDKYRKIYFNNIIFCSCSLGVNCSEGSLVDIYFDFYCKGLDCYSFLVDTGGYGFIGEDWRNIQNVYRAEINGDIHGNIICSDIPSLEVLES